jgi:hypothetical protein
MYRSFDALIGPEIMNVAFLDLDQGKLTLPRVAAKRLLRLAGDGQVDDLAYG